MAGALSALDRFFFLLLVLFLISAAASAAATVSSTHSSTLPENTSQHRSRDTMFSVSVQPGAAFGRVPLVATPADAPDVGGGGSVSSSSVVAAIAVVVERVDYKKERLSGCKYAHLPTILSV